MAAIIDRIKAEPAVVIGIVGSIILFAIDEFAGKGIITADTGTNLTNLVRDLLPLITGLVTRQFVSPA